MKTAALARSGLFVVVVVGLWACAGTGHEQAMPDQPRDAASYPASAFAVACDRWDNWDKPAPPDYRWADHPEYLRDYRPSIEWLMSVDADLCLSAHPSQTRLIDRINADQLVDSSGCRSAAVGILNRLEGILAALTTPRYPL